jgi:hypothetical protein
MFTCRRPPFVFCHSLRHSTLAFLVAAYWLLASCPLQAANPAVVACYGCASAAINRNYGTPSGIYNLTVTATGGTVQHSVLLTLTVR